MSVHYPLSKEQPLHQPSLFAHVWDPRSSRALAKEQIRDRRNKMPRRYRQFEDVRLEIHDMIETRFADGHADDLHSSSTSLHLDDGSPRLRYVDGVIQMFYGDQYQYTLTAMSDMLTDDRVYSPQGHVALSDTVKDVYKEYTRALHDKMFRLEGPYDCANEYIKSGLSRREHGGLPMVRADALYPYYFKMADSPLTGTVAYQETLPFANSEETRRVTVVNVRGNTLLIDDKKAERVDHKVIYLGGNHDGEVLPSDRSQADMLQANISKQCKFIVCYENASTDGPGGYGFGRKYISSPFPNTWLGHHEELNVGLAKLRDGKFLYWGTNFQPEPGKQLSKLPREEVAEVMFYGNNGKCDSWPLDEENDSRFDTIEGAWVLRGDRLVQEVNEKGFPQGVLARLRSGFFHPQGKEVRAHNFTRITARVKKCIGSFERYGGKMFGFGEDQDGMIECGLDKLADHLRISVETLLTYLGDFGSAFRYFRGTVEFLLYEQTEGKLKITEPVPVGRWMSGRVVDTGTGLLFVIMNKKYFSVETVGEVSWLSEYTGPGITEGRKLKLGKYIGYRSAPCGE